MNGRFFIGALSFILLVSATDAFSQQAVVKNLASAAAGAPADNWAVGSYKVETSYESSGGRRFAIIRNGQTLFSKDVGQFWFVAVERGKPSKAQHEPVLADVTGDGVPDLIVEEYPIG